MFRCPVRRALIRWCPVIACPPSWTVCAEKTLLCSCGSRILFYTILKKILSVFHKMYILREKLF